VLPFLAWIVVAAVPTRTNVRSSGVLVCWLRSRLFAYRDIVDVRRNNGDLVLVLSSGQRVRLPVQLRTRRTARHPHAGRDTLFLAIREHLERAREEYGARPSR
jgi:hypothetical protein